MHTSSRICRLTSCMWHDSVFSHALAHNNDVAVMVCWLFDLNMYSCACVVCMCHEGPTCMCHGGSCSWCVCVCQVQPA